MSLDIESGMPRLASPQLCDTNTLSCDAEEGGTARPRISQRKSAICELFDQTLMMMHSGAHPGRHPTASFPCLCVEIGHCLLPRHEDRSVLAGIMDGKNFLIHNQDHMQNASTRQTEKAFLSSRLFEACNVALVTKGPNSNLMCGLEDAM